MTDESYMLEALKLAMRGRGHTRPNPPVGAVVVRCGKILGRGWHRKCGGDHAEVAAIRNAGDCRGATIYVTLEPCSRPGRVGACTDAIIAAGISRVVYAERDPNPINRGRAKKVLNMAGIRCDRLSGVVGTAELIRPFAKRVTTGLPYVTVKLAMSLDGKICDDWGNAKWVSSKAARKITGELREYVDAIMVGAETVRKDNPSLLSHGRRNDDLMRVVVSRSGRLSRNSQIFTDEAPNKTLVYGDARKAIVELGKLGVMHVLCEGGLELATSLADEGLVDEWITVLSPCVIGHRRIDSRCAFMMSKPTLCLQQKSETVNTYQCLPD